MSTLCTCELCLEEGGELLFSDQFLRVVLAADPIYPGFCRVVWREHVKEMSDLSLEARNHLMSVVWQVELAIRETMSPDKVNLASLGNVTPHLHWHVIPRYVDDAHFPAPVWAEVKRSTRVASLDARSSLIPALRAAITSRLSQSPV